jgi:putative ubiquitin-RnfH superfamily antitoxin RatB of RatAB toxin-antitoxin module
LKHCSVVCDTAAGLLACELELPDDATIDRALAAARDQLGEGATDWEHTAIGIYGRLRVRSHVFADGDRIELYRPLQLDPRAKRRERALPHRGDKR